MGIAPPSHWLGAPGDPLCPSCKVVESQGLRMRLRRKQGVTAACVDIPQTSSDLPSHSNTGCTSSPLPPTLGLYSSCHAVTAAALGANAIKEGLGRSTCAVWYRQTLQSSCRSV